MSAYDRILQKKKKNSLKNNNRILTPMNDSQIASQRSDQPNNIFLQNKDKQDKNSYQQIDYQFQNNKKTYINIKNKSGQTTNNKQQSFDRYKKSKMTQNKQIIKQQKQNKIQIVDDNDIPQGDQDQIQQQNTKFSLFQSLKYYMGHQLKLIQYPINKIIYIDNNNQQQNDNNRKHAALKKKNISSNNLINSNQYYFQNTFKVSSILVFLHILIKIFFNPTNILDFYLFLAITIINGLVQKYIFLSNAQYVGDSSILIVMIVLNFVGRYIFQYFLIKNRKFNKQFDQKYKIYFHNGISAEWKNISANQIKAGYIYKISKNSIFPVDSVLLHSAQSILYINAQNLKSKLISTISKNNIKEALIKTQNIVLPLSGLLEYHVFNQDKKQNWMEGKLFIQQPQKNVYNLTQQNIVLRGTINTSQCQIVCMALQVGPNTLNLKNIQYPYLYKDYQQILYKKRPQFLTINRLITTFTNYSLLVYLIMSLIGILIGFLTSTYNNDNFYLGDSINILYIIFYHFMNFVILIPIWLRLAIVIGQYFIAKNIQKNISEREFQFISKQNRQENIQSQKIGKLQIKQLSILPYLKENPILITGIDIFRGNKQYNLKKIKVKEVIFQIGKHKLNNQLFEDQHKKLVKYFMAVSLLTIGNQNQNEKNMLTFEAHIKKVANQQFGLKINISNKYITVNGQLNGLFSGGQLKVIHFFTIKNSLQFPYTVSFYEIPSEQNIQNKDKKVLCIIRGDPQTILMKVYGKQVSMMSQSQKLYKQFGYRNQMVGKFTLFYNQAQNIKKYYQGSSSEYKKFYSLFQKSFVKIQPMGLLIFQNQYEQKKPSKNLNNSFLNMSFVKRLSSESNLFSSQNLPYLIILSPKPQPYYLHPQFESIHSISSLLANPYLFNFTAKQAAQKILHQPIPVQNMIQKLKQQKIIVWNGWDIKNIKYMLQLMHEKNALTMAYIDKDQQLYLSKICDYSLGIENSEDISKYCDITIKKPNIQMPSIYTFLTLIQLFKHDSHQIYNSLYQIVLIYIIKFIFYVIVEAINYAYTLGTGITMVRLSLYIITQIIVFCDVFFYINFANRIKQKVKNPPNLWIQILKSSIFMITGTFILIYCSVTPHTQYGTPVNSIFLTLQVHFLFTHLLIFIKVSWTSSLNLYKMMIVLVQIIIYYISIIILSQTSLYQFNGILRYTFNNKLYLVSIILIWVFSMSFFSQLIIKNRNIIFNQNETKNKKTNKDNQYQQVKRLKQDVTLDILENQ